MRSLILLKSGHFNGGHRTVRSLNGSSAPISTTEAFRLVCFESGTTGQGKAEQIQPIFREKAVEIDWQPNGPTIDVKMAEVSKITFIMCFEPLFFKIKWAGFSIIHF